MPLDHKTRFPDQPDSDSGQLWNGRQIMKNGCYLQGISANQSYLWLAGIASGENKLLTLEPTIIIAIIGVPGW